MYISEDRVELRLCGFVCSLSFVLIILEEESLRCSSQSNYFCNSRALMTRRVYCSYVRLGNDVAKACCCYLVLAIVFPVFSYYVYIHIYVCVPSCVHVFRNIPRALKRERERKGECVYSASARSQCATKRR